jgi:hypothetical protein
VLVVDIATFQNGSSFPDEGSTIGVGNSICHDSRRFAFGAFGDLEMRDKYFLAWGRNADEYGPERDDTVGKIVSIESFFVELEILSVNGNDIEQECTILSSLDELELRGTVFFKTLAAAEDHYKKVRADIASQEAGKHGRGNKVVDFGGPRPRRR